MDLDGCLAVFRLVLFYNITGKAIASVWSHWIPSVNPSLTTVAVRGLACAAALLLNYGWELRSYHLARRASDAAVCEAELPPRFPSQIPFLGNVIPFLADSANFVTRVG